MKYSLLIFFFSCYATSDFAMQRSVTPLITRTEVASLIVRTYASRNNGIENSSTNKEEDIFKNIKENLGTKSDFFCCAYLGTLFFIYYRFCMPKSAYRDLRSSDRK